MLREHYRMTLNLIPAIVKRLSARTHSPRENTRLLTKFV